jgi:hypothetical protein
MHLIPEDKNPYALLPREENILETPSEKAAKKKEDAAKVPEPEIRPGPFFWKRLVVANGPRPDAAASTSKPNSNNAEAPRNADEEACCNCIISQCLDGRNALIMIKKFPQQRDFFYHNQN